MSWFKKNTAKLKAKSQASGTTNRPAVHDIQFFVDNGGSTNILRLVGFWDIKHVAAVDFDFNAFGQGYSGKSLTIDTQKIERFDTAGAWLIERLMRHLKSKGCTVNFISHIAEHQKLLNALADVPENKEVQTRQSYFGVEFLESTGKAMVDIKNDCILGLHIIGSMLRGSQMKSSKKIRTQFTSVIFHLYKMAVTGAPIVLLMSLLIGGIITQQSAFYLKYFGAELWTVDLVGILVLREIGVLLTAIMVAGRTGSSMTAEIGSMKMREEVDALTVIGLNPISVLIWPRIIALVIALPLLTILANFMAIVGAFFICQIYVGIVPETFISHLRTAIDLSTIFSGLIKAPFMALVIGVVAAIEGVKVGGSAESLGRRVTSAVVKAIFMVILMDGLFAIFYATIEY
jgi:phospholipid/cholesterol/gamma-HCH transport system permease protein